MNSRMMARQRATMADATRSTAASVRRAVADSTSGSKNDTDAGPPDDDTCPTCRVSGRPSMTNSGRTSPKNTSGGTSLRLRQSLRGIKNFSYVSASGWFGAWARAVRNRDTNLVPLCFRSSCQRLLRRITNFGNGAPAFRTSAQSTQKHSSNTFAGEK